MIYGARWHAQHAPLTIAAIALACACGERAAPPVDWPSPESNALQLIALDLSPGVSSSALAVNGSGEVVGAWRPNLSAPSNQPFLWTSSFGLQTLPGFTSPRGVQLMSTTNP